MKNEVVLKSYRCGFMVTARIVAWLWRRQGYHTDIGTFLHHANGTIEIGYRVTGLFTGRKKGE